VTRLSDQRIAELLAGPQQGLLSMSRPDRGPVTVPMTYLFDGGLYMITSPASVHGRINPA